MRKMEVSYPVPSMNEFMRHLFPLWFVHYEVGGRVRVVLRHPTRYIGTEVTFTTEELYRLYEEDTIGQDELATSDFINTITTRLLSKYLEILKTKKYEEFPLVSDWLRCQILGSEFTTNSEEKQ